MELKGKRKDTKTVTKTNPSENSQSVENGGKKQQLNLIGSSSIINQKSYGSTVISNTRHKASVQSTESIGSVEIKRKSQRVVNTEIM